MSEKHLLIVDKSPHETAEIRTLLPVLTGNYRLDAFTARQRLIGRGLALFAEGKREQLEELALVLRDHGIVYHLVHPTPPRFAPTRVRHFRISENRIEFIEQQTCVVLERGDRVLAVLADLSGALVDKSIKRLLVQNAYRGAAAVTPIDEEALYRTVLRSRPVLDLYFLDQQNGIRAAVRIFAGRFDPRGLGGHATCSVAGNMDNLVRLVREYAGQFTLKTDFGLAQVPGCRLKKPEEGQSYQRENLNSLTRFGWLSVDLETQVPAENTIQAEMEKVATPAAAAALQQPVLAAAAAGVEGIKTIPEEGLRQEPSPPEELRESEPGLPPPPDTIDRSGRRRWGDLLGWLGGGLGLGVYVLLKSGTEGFGMLLDYGIRTGMLPAVLSAALFWAGFHYLRLKRQVENTPTSKTRSLAMGMVEVHGRARRQYALASPMTQMPCVYYRVRHYRRAENSNWFLTGESDSGGCPFYLEDGTGRVSIDPRGATVKARTRHEGFPGQMTLLLSSAGSTDSNEKWVEEIIYEGTSLYVLGCARPRKVSRKTLRERTIEALRELKLDPKALQKYDTDGDGRISEEEWEAARGQVEEQVLHQSLAEEQQTAPSATHVVIGRPKSPALPFIVAETESEARLTRNFGLLTTPLFAGALVTAVWTLVLFAKIFGFR